MAWQESLQRANEVRLARVAQRRDVKAGEVEVTELLDDPPSLIYSLKVIDLLMWEPGIGESRARDILAASGEIRETKPVGELTERQRRVLCQQIAEKPHGHPSTRCRA
jgi:hypothetical protein